MLAGALGFGLALCAAALFILTTLSTPVIHRLALLHISLAGEWVADFGVLGVCYVLPGRPTKSCTSPSAGYTFPPTLLALASVADVSVAPKLIRGLTGALLLNAVAGGLAALAVVLWAAAALARSRLVGILLLGMVVGLAAFALDLALVLVVRDRVWSLTDGRYSAHIETGFWLAMAGSASLLIAVIAGAKSLTTAGHKDTRGMKYERARKTFWKGEKMRGTY